MPSSVLARTVEALVLGKLQPRGRGAARIAFLGGSLTYGHGVTSGEDTWPQQFRRALLEIWGAAELTIHNGACPGLLTHLDARACVG